MTASFMNRTFAFGTAALALALVAVIGLGVYFSRPAVVPGLSPSPTPSPASASPTAAADRTPESDVSPAPTGSPVPRRVVYTVTKTLPIGDHSNYVYNRIWVAQADGSNAHELMADPSVVGAEPASQDIVGWLPDGSGLLYTEGWSEGTVDLFMTDADGSEPRLICLASACPSAVNGDISPDGRQLAFASPDGIAILDLASGHVARLDIPPAGGLGVCDAGARAVWGVPTWSLDGTELQFDSGYWSLQHDFCGVVLVAVNIDGSNMRTLPSEEPVELSTTRSPGGRYLQPLPQGDR
jgi:Tol biopolymer transport system component